MNNAKEEKDLKNNCSVQLSICPIQVTNDVLNHYIIITILSSLYYHHYIIITINNSNRKRNKDAPLLTELEKQNN